MKKYLTSLCLLAIITLLSVPLFSAHAVAFDPFRPTGNNSEPTAVCDRVDSTGSKLPNSPVCTADGSNPITGTNGLINKVANIFATIIGFAAIVMIIVGGFEYVRSGGDSSKVNKAKNTILFAVIGLVVTVVARSVVALVISRL